MTVEELIERLKKMPPEAYVVNGLEVMDITEVHKKLIWIDGDQVEVVYIG